MLMLLFYVGRDCYALDCEYVVEIIPRVKLKNIPHAPDYFSGLLNFGGMPIPVIDICQIIQGRPSAPCLHTRIILLNYFSPVGESSYLGMIAEKVTESVDREKSEFIDPGLVVKDLPFLGGVLNEEKTSMQLLSVEDLFKSMGGVLLKETLNQ